MAIDDESGPFFESLEAVRWAEVMDAIDRAHWATVLKRTPAENLQDCMLTDADEVEYR